MYISTSNHKMNIPTWSLPSGKTCPGKTKQCRKFCYALKAEVQYPGCLPCRENNLSESKKSDFADKMISKFKRAKKVHKVGYLRIHESGDFYNQKYLDNWIEISKAYPKVTFLAFTKSFGLDYSKKPDNLIIYWSIWPDTKDAPKKGLYAFAGYCKTKRKVIECPGLCDNCLVCFKGSTNVHFDIH